MATSDEYKQQIMQDLAAGNVESLGEVEENISEKYQSFDDFAQRSSREERHQLFSTLHPDRVPAAQMVPELQKAIAQIKPGERDDVSRAIFKRLKDRGFQDKQLEQQLGLSTHNPNRMNAEDVGKLSTFVYNSHPDIFQEVIADQPALVKFLSNPLVGAALGAIAAKWLGGSGHR
jgi:Glu-tRNA(Gln) amidotransferase subunit E-like FAD-binding protein